MKIVADENIPLIDKFFAPMGKVVTLPGRTICREHVRDADILLVRSVTEVNESLLGESSVRFVGSTTIGTDHLDTAWLEANGIRYANAPGCNANAVIEYVISALIYLAEYDQFSLADKTIGVVGRGNVGGELVRRLQKFGLNVLVNDPPLEAQGVSGLVSLEEVLEADIISLHVPLTYSGDCPTYHLIDDTVLNQLGDGQYLINTSRGAVVDNRALAEKLAGGTGLRVVLDVWENEPFIDAALLEKVLVGTPHIAGYSLDGKAMGSELVYRELCRFLGLPARCKSAQYLPEPPLTKLGFSSQAEADWAVSMAVRCSYDVRIDNWKLKGWKKAGQDELGHYFDFLRKHYPVRREFGNIKVQMKNAEADLMHKIKALGFNVK